MAAGPPILPDRKGALVDQRRRITRLRARCCRPVGGAPDRISHQQYTHRSHAEVLRFFDGLEMVEPGLVELRHWRPTIESNRVTRGWCGLGRKP